LPEIREALEYARTNALPLFVLGGGSNIVIADGGFNGLVMHIATRGISVVSDGNDVLLTAASGESWDSFVGYCVRHDYAGVECLSGIPGSIGATPIQNVGAYGQEVRETITSVELLDRATGELHSKTNADCAFGYRQSRFKQKDAERYIVAAVTFRLRQKGTPVIRYPEVEKTIGTSAAGTLTLQLVRDAVLALRRGKSMVVDPDDPHSRSVGSFFMNPVLDQKRFDDVGQRWRNGGGVNPIPSYPAAGGVKVPAAWLVENAGFPKGFRLGNVGVSLRHSLALVNYGGTSVELLELARIIQNAVHERFGILLEREPVIVPA
jgi:UDP-N-acetylmuramate dehydrogenase